MDNCEDGHVNTWGQMSVVMGNTEHGISSFQDFIQVFCQTGEENVANKGEQ